MSDVVGSFMDFVRATPGHVLAALETPWPYVAEAVIVGVVVICFEVRRCRRRGQTGSSSQ